MRLTNQQYKLIRQKQNLNIVLVKRSRSLNNHLNIFHNKLFQNHSNIDLKILHFHHLSLKINLKYLHSKLSKVIIYLIMIL
jgi:hypothetical protein